MPLKRRTQKMFDSVTERIKNQTQGGLKVNPETGVRYEEPLEEKHPGLTVGVAAAQPGTILEKLLAPSVYKVIARSIGEGNLSEALMAGIAPVKGISLTRVPESALAEMLHEEAIAEAGALKNGTLGSSKFRPMPSKPITEAEKLGIPKSERSNPKSLEDPQYWGYKQWNSRYNKAVDSGDLEEVQRLRDLHFKIKAPDTKVVDKNGNPLHMYHGLLDHASIEKAKMFTKFKGVNRDLENAVEFGNKTNHWKLSVPNGNRMKSYHTPDYDHALNSYAFGHTDKVYNDYLNIKRPFTWNEEELYQLLHPKYNWVKKSPPSGMRTIVEHTPNGSVWRRVPETRWSYEGISDWADFSGHSKEELMKLGYDGLYIPQYYNSYGVFVSPSQFKSAEAITHDNFGNIIPIVKRDNFYNLDRRFKQGGKLKRR